MFFPSSANTTSKANKIRVLHVINALDHGGAEVYAMQLILGLRVHGVDSHLAFTHQGTMTNRAARLGVPMAHVSRHLFSFRSPLRSLLAMVRLYQYIRRQGIRVVHAHIFEPYFWVAPAAWFAGVPLIRTVVGTRRDAQWWAPLPERLLARITTAFVVFSGSSKAEIKGFGVEDRRIHTIPNGVSFNLGTLPDDRRSCSLCEGNAGIEGQVRCRFRRTLALDEGADRFSRSRGENRKAHPRCPFRNGWCRPHGCGGSPVREGFGTRGPCFVYRLVRGRFRAHSVVRCVCSVLFFGRDADCAARGHGAGGPCGCHIGWVRSGGDQGSGARPGGPSSYPRSYFPRRC